ncbi:MAG: AraC family transcriptional regulator [Turicibacter sp.]
MTNTNTPHKELINHGSDRFPLNLYHTVLKKGMHDLYLHWHDEIEIIYIASGTGVFQINLTDYQVKQGDFLFIKKGDLHRGMGCPFIGCECYTLVFHLKFLQSHNFDLIETTYFRPLLKEDLLLSPHLTKESQTYEQLYTLFNQLRTQFQLKAYGYEVIVKGLMLQLIGCMIQSHSSQPILNLKTSKKITAMKTVIQYIQLNYHKKISISTLSQLVGYSDYHFIRFFKQETGTTCTEYINQLRLSKAYEWIQTTDKSITEIAFDCGFENLSYFSKKYKEHYHMTAAQTRKNNNIL